MNKFIFELQCFAETINLTEGNDEYSNSTPKVIINGLGGRDSIYNNGENVTINGGAGKNRIISYSGSNMKIDGGETMPLITLTAVKIQQSTAARAMTQSKVMALMSQSAAARAMT